MAADPWPCRHCDAPGVRNLAGHGYCAHHLEQLHARFDPAVFAYNGVGRVAGIIRPDHGPHAAELECNACGATWIGRPGDPCAWCAHAYRTMIEHQAELVLQPPDVDLDDQRRPQALEAWAQRMWTAVQAGLIDQRQAERALQREVAHAA